MGQCLDEIRLSHNISQAQLAKQAGVSRSTLTRLADGKPISLDSFVRVIQALDLTDSLAALLPDPSIRPVERLNGKQRQRARANNKDTSVQPNRWTWSDEGDK